VSGAQVSLSLWPTRYATGCWVEVDDECVPGDCPDPLYAPYPNEDANRNLILDVDAGEDTGANPGHGDGQLTPPSSAAGSVPSTVTTDENGVANFNLVYLKASAAWIEDEIRASTLVLGTETQVTYTFWLGWLKTDSENCLLTNSPYNP